MLTLFAYSIGNNLYGMEVGRTMAFISLGMLELVHSFNIKSDESIFKSGLFENKYLILISFAPIIIMEIQKWFNEMKFGKRVYMEYEKQN